MASEPRAPGLLQHLRRQLTAWYVATLALTLAILGTALFLTISHQLNRFIDRTLRQRIADVERAARTHATDEDAPPGGLASLDDLRFVDRNVFLLTGAGAPITPAVQPAFAATATARLAANGRYVGELVAPRDSHRTGSVRVRAERFRLADSAEVVAVAAMDSSEWNEEYLGLIAAFGGAALLALVLIAFGGRFLVRKSLAPIESSIERMRHFMSDAAHELRTPVTVIRTGAEVALRQQRDPVRDATALTGIAAESRRLGGIVDDLLILARADSGERPIERASLFLDDMVTDAANAARPLAEAAGVSLMVDQFDEAQVTGDATLLRQLVMILLDNAIKFTPRGGEVRVRVGVDAGQSVVAIRDSGIGVAPEDLPRIFERFFRAERARPGSDDVPAPSGAGLGLAIARWIVDAHHAVIAVQSAPGEGTTVTVRFASSAAPVSAA